VSGLARGWAASGLDVLVNPRCNGFMRMVAEPRRDMDADREAARGAFERHEWVSAFERFSRLDQVEALDVGDLERLAGAADMAGHLETGIATLRRVYNLSLRQGRVGRALRAGYWLCKSLQFHGNAVQASAWQARLARLGEEYPRCPEGGYPLLLIAETAARSGRFPEAMAGVEAAVARVVGSDDPDLRAMTRLMQGIALLETGRLEEGLTELDEAMESATEGALSPRATGFVYCMVIGACQSVYDVDRARVWTAALASWCEAQPDFTGGYRGLCLVHRVEVLQLGGAWAVAMEAAVQACGQLGEEGALRVVTGAAHHRIGELHRLRGEYAAAEASFREAVARGWEPQPGLALLRLAAGRADVAAAAVRRALSEASGHAGRCALLAAAVEIFLTLNDAAAAAEAAAELEACAQALPMPAVEATAGHARGSVLLEAGNPAAALGVLRHAWRQWRDLDAPYEAARTRVLVARACRLLGDEDSAVMELDAARQVFSRLGAAPDVASLDQLLGVVSSEPSVLSPREQEVLRLVADGLSNHEIARQLVLSDRTVARHVGNILAKLQVGSRTAAAAYAFKHRLV
jgi:DNA-binding CsgD family transcriptional regulator